MHVVYLEPDSTHLMTINCYVKCRWEVQSVLIYAYMTSQYLSVYTGQVDKFHETNANQSLRQILLYLQPGLLQDVQGIYIQ